MKKSVQKSAIAAKAFNTAVAEMGSATFDEICRLYVSSFMYTTISIFEDEPKKLVKALEFFKDYVAEIDSEDVAKILDNGWEKHEKG